MKQYSPEVYELAAKKLLKYSSPISNNHEYSCMLQGSVSEDCFVSKAAETPNRDGFSQQIHIGFALTEAELDAAEAELAKKPLEFSDEELRTLAVLSHCDRPGAADLCMKIQMELHRRYEARRITDGADVSAKIS